MKKHILTLLIILSILGIVEPVSSKEEIKKEAEKKIIEEVSDKKKQKTKDLKLEPKKKEEKKKTLFKKADLEKKKDESKPDVMIVDIPSVGEQPVREIVLDENYSESVLQFEVNKNRLLLNDPAFLKAYKDKEVVQVRLPGDLLKEPAKVKIIKKEKARRNNLQNTINAIYSANAKGDLEWLLSNFASSDREKIRKLYDEKKLVIDDVKKYFDKQKSQELLGDVTYKDYKIAFVKQIFKDGSIGTDPIVLKKVGNQWFQTLDLDYDPTYDVIHSSLLYGKTSKGRVYDPEGVNEKYYGKGGSKVPGEAKGVKQTVQPIRESNKLREKTFIPKHL